MLLENDFDDLRYNKDLLDQLMIGFTKLPKLKDKKVQEEFDILIKNLEKFLNNVIKRLFEPDNEVPLEDANFVFREYLKLIVEAFKLHFKKVEQENGKLDIDLDDMDFEVENIKLSKRIPDTDLPNTYENKKK